MTYSFQAEHIADFQSLMAEIKAMKGASEVSGARNALFSSFHTIVADCAEEVAIKIQDLIFEYNDGAYCRFEEVVYAEEEDYI